MLARVVSGLAGVLSNRVSPAAKNTGLVKLIVGTVAPTAQVSVPTGVFDPPDTWTSVITQLAVAAAVALNLEPARPTGKVMPIATLCGMISEMPSRPVSVKTTR